MFSGIIYLDQALPHSPEVEIRKNPDVTGAALLSLQRGTGGSHPRTLMPVALGRTYRVYRKHRNPDHEDTTVPLTHWALQNPPFHLLETPTVHCLSSGIRQLPANPGP